MWSIRAVGSVTTCLLIGILVHGCGDDQGNEPPDGSTFLDVQAVLTKDCSGCHTLGSGRVFLATMDSAQLVNSGLVDPADPSQSLLLLKPLKMVPHGGGRIDSFDQRDSLMIADWITRQPEAGGRFLTASKVPAGSAPPIVDGYYDGAWANAQSTTYLIGGGWADATSVQIAALYDDTYLYLRVSWIDDKASHRRQPWVKKADGTWAVLPAKPAPTSGTTWAQYMGADFNEENTAFAYEDKLAIMWNTYGAGTVTGFDQSGCAVTCHDPGNAFGPGTTYNTDPSLAAKKYTNAPGQIADIWHWKMVRQNQHMKVDDQYVGYWVPSPTGAPDAGRGSDVGSGGYVNNPAVNGHPGYLGPIRTLPPGYILDWEKIPMSDSLAAGLPAGTEIQGIITSGVTLGRADIDGFGRYNATTHTWVMEIRRALIPTDTTDVFFDDLTRQYSFGIAVFDNAQIEHSYMSSVGKLVFKP